MVRVQKCFFWGDLIMIVTNRIIICRCNQICTSDYDYCPNCGMDLLSLARVEPWRVKKDEKMP